VVSWIGTGVSYCQSDRQAEPMVGWKNAHPQSIRLAISHKQISILVLYVFEYDGWLAPVFAFQNV